MRHRTSGVVMVGNEEKIERILANQYYADFETTTEVNHKRDGRVRVYMWGLKDSYGNYWKGTNLREFIERIKLLSQNRTITVWFHNLKFDFSFLEWYFLRTMSVHYKPKDKMNKWTTFGKEYSTLRDGMNMLYGTEWFVDSKSTINFRDSAKLYPMPLSALGGMVNMPKLTEQFDYFKYITGDYNPTEEEWEYMDHDVEIVRRIVMKQIKRAGVVRMTRTGYAFHGLRKKYIDENTPKNWNEIKKTLRKPDGTLLKKNETIFEVHFPVTDPELYDEMKAGYAGGVTQLMPQYKGKTLGNMVTYDVNSEYPSVMLDRWYPIGKEERFTGNYHNVDEETKKERPLFIQKFKAKFHLKEDGFPSLPKKLSQFNRTVYSHEDLKARGMLTMTNVDIEHFYKNYHVSDVEYIGGWHWRQTYAPFKSYIEQLAEEKINAEESGDMIGRQISKLEMNGCYGKFAQNPHRTSKNSYIDEEGVVRYESVDEEPESQQYFPMGIFITAYARDVLFNGIYKAGMDRFVYCDTDSIHLLGYESVEGLDVHPTRLGAWDWEEEGEDGDHNYIVKAKYLREKCYAHYHKYHVGADENGQPRHIEIKAAGLSEEAKGTIKDINEFNLGQSYSGSLTQFQVEGGTLLKDTEKLLKDESFAPGELKYLEMLETEKAPV